MYLPSRMQGKGLLWRALALSRVCSNTHDTDTLRRRANSCGVMMSSGLKDAAAFPVASKRSSFSSRCEVLVRSFWHSQQKTDLRDQSVIGIVSRMLTPPCKRLLLLTA
jgi:hypothetical protein